MAIDYAEIGLSIGIFILYLAIIVTCIEIRRKLNKEAGRAFIYVIIAIIFLTVNRAQEIFFNSGILKGVPYYEDYLRLVFAILFFLGALSFYRILKKAGGSRLSRGGSLKEYKRSIGGKIIR